MIEKLICLTITRPDIIFVVRVLSRFMHKPREVHWTTTLRILSYLKSSLEEVLLYKKYGHAHISSYSDLGYACDKRNVKSTNGYCTFIGENLMT